MKHILILALCIQSLISFAKLEQKIFLTKANFEQQEFNLKKKKETHLIQVTNKANFKFLSSEHKFNELTSLLSTLDFENLNCVEWVYKGSASRQESVEACRGVFDTVCLEFVYKGSASREESARSCRGVSSKECLDFVYKGSASREESARSCRGVRDMECVEFVYRGSASREESARSCANSRPNRRPDRC